MEHIMKFLDENNAYLDCEWWYKYYKC
jgi:hypothetical protein